MARARSGFAFVLPLSATLSVALAHCASPKPHPSEPEAAPVEVTTLAVKTESLDVIYRASGTVRGRNTATLTSKNVGYVRAVKVQAGDVVTAGQLLAVLEANDVVASVRRAGAGLVQAKESRLEAEHALEVARVNAKNAKSTRDRMAALVKDGSIPQQQFDDVDAQYRAAAAQEEMAQARFRGSASRIDQASAEMGEAQATLDYARIVAPFAGRVIERRVDPGNLASPGMPLLVVEQDGRLRVESAIAESRAASVRLGDQALAEIEALPRPVAGTVAEIVPAVDVSSRAFLVKVDLPPDLAGLRPGMFARLGFTVGKAEHLVVPRDAVTSHGALDRVFVVDGDHARLRMISVGESQGALTQVLSGLLPGERVVSHPPSSLRDGSRVTEKK